MESAATSSRRLPTWNTWFVGREAELAAAAAVLDERRLVTFIGAGGCGKTRLAVELARALALRLPDGVCFVDLAPVAGHEGLAVALRAALGLDEIPGLPAADAAVDHLAGRSALVLLDNCEHLVAAAAALAGRLVAECDGVRVLATSREPLGAAGEAGYRVPSLPVPAHDDDVDCPSVALFADRARLARAPDGYPEADRPAVLQICRALDGLPLAIELAAAQCRTLRPTEILAQLSDRLLALPTPQRTGLPRHRTLEASIDWSYRRLDEEHRRVLRRLSVFAGTFTAEAAAAVCGDADAAADDRTADVLNLLVDSSLVEVPFGSGRFRLLQTIRQFLRRELAAACEEETALARHADFFVQQTERLGAALITAEAGRARHAIEDDLTEIRAADDHLARVGVTPALLRMHGALRLYWSREHPHEGCNRVTRALAAGVGDPVERGRAFMALGEAAWFSGRLEEGLASAAEAFQIEEAADPGPLRGELRALGFLDLCLGDPRGHDRLRGALEDLLCGGERYWIFDARWNLGLAAQAGGDSEQAVAHFRTALSEAGDLGHEQAVGVAEVFLGLEHVLRGEYRDARPLLRDGRAALERLGEHATVYFAVAGLARVASAAGEIETARALLDEVWDEVQRRQQGVALGWLCWVRMLIEHGESPQDAPTPWLDDAQEAMTAEGAMWMWGLVWCHAIRAERLSGCADAAGARAALLAAAELGDHPFAGRGRPRLHLAESRVNRAEGNRPAAIAAAHEALRAAAAAGAAAEVVEALEQLGVLGADADGASEAVRLLAAAEAARAAMAHRRPPYEAAAVDAAAGRLRGDLGPAEFDRVSAEGAALGLPDAVAYAQRGWGEHRRAATGWESLTPTEQEVARLAARGLRNAEIATTMFVSTATVKTHLIRIFRKLEVRNRAELAAQARDRA